MRLTWMRNMASTWSAEHKVATVTLAFVIGLLTAGYHIFLQFFFRSTGERYYPFTPLSLAGNFHVFPQRIREYLDGYIWIADFNIFEYRFWPLANRPPLPAILYAIPSKIWGLEWGWMVAETAGAMIIFLLLVLFCYRLSRHRWGSILWSFFLVTGSPMTAFLVFPTSIIELKELAKLILPWVVTENFVPRMQYLTVESILPSVIIFIPFLVLLHAIWSSSRRAVVLSLGCVFGLLFFTYPFYWMAASVAIAVTVILAIVTKQKDVLRRVVIAGAIGSFLSIGFWYMFFSLHALPQYTEVFDRSTQVEFGRVFYWLDLKYYLLLFLTSVALWWLRRTKRITNATWFFTLTLYLTVIIGLNVQFVTGYTFSHDHWIIKVLHLPFAAIVGVIGMSVFDHSFFSQVRASRSRRWIVAGMICVWLIVGAVNAQFLHAIKDIHRHRLPEAVQDVLMWLDVHTPPDSVVLSPSFYIQELIPAFTDDRVFLPHVWNTAMSFAELKDRFLLSHALFAVSPERVYALFNPPSAERVKDATGAQLIRNGVDSHTYLVGFGYRELRTETYQQDIVDAYKKYPGVPEEWLNRYRVDYVVIMDADLPLLGRDPAELPFLKEVFRTPGARVFVVEKATSI